MEKKMSCEDTLGVNSPGTFSANVFNLVVNGTLTAHQDDPQNINLSGNLTVAGNTNLANVTVVGQSTLQNVNAEVINSTDQNMTGSMDILGSLDVSGAANVNSLNVVSNITSPGISLNSGPSLQVYSGLQPYTPVLTFGGASVGMAYTVQTGSYVKIGQQVTVAFAIQLAAVGSSVGPAAMSVPFTCEVTTGNSYTTSLSFSAVHLDAGFTALSGLISGGTTVALFEDGSDQPDTPLSNTNFTIGSFLSGTFCYFTPA
jgi:hypothetical protein